MDVGNQVGALLRTLRTIEQRNSTLRQKIRLTDQNLLESKKTMRKEVQSLSSEITELRAAMESINFKFSLVQKQLQEAAPKEDLDVLAKYIGFWQPMNFVTKQEAKKIIQSGQVIAPR